MDRDIRLCNLEVELLHLVVDVADLSANTSGRRQLLLERLGELFSTSAGLWAWGTGRPDTECPNTVGALHFGLDRSQLSRFQQFSLSDKSREEFQRPIMAHLNHEDDILCVVRRDIIDDAHWKPQNWVYDSVHSIGMNSWMHSVRYGCKEKWSSVLLFRDTEKPEFGDHERTVMRQALANIRWLWAPLTTPDTKTPTGHLTERQRTVMWLLLSGLPRKGIAARLCITEDTVGDHVKAIFLHFKVESSMELAALFIRTQ